MQVNIDKEVVERKEADAALKEELKEYVDNSAATGDTALQVVKDNLAKEIQDRKDADAILQANIDKETVDRKDADKPIPIISLLLLREFRIWLYQCRMLSIQLRTN